MSRIIHDMTPYTDLQKRLLVALIDKHEQYTRQGRDLEAVAMHKSFRMVKRSFRPDDFQDTEPTGWGSL